MNEKEEVRVELDQLLDATRYLAKNQRQDVAPKQKSWVDQMFAPAENLSDFLGRLSWCVLIPGILGLLYVPIARWGWMNGYPMPVLIVTTSVIGIYALVYIAASKTAASRILADAVNFWMALPVLSAFACIALGLWQ